MIFADFLAHWVHDLDPVIFRISDKLQVRWYGLAYISGFFAAWFLLFLYWKKNRSPWDPDAQSTLLTAIIIGVLAGGRLGYVFLYDFSNFLSDPLLVFRVWEGGMASHGGFIGVVLACLWFSWKSKTPALKTGDIVATLPAIGIFFGRIANFINGELWGKVSDVPWAVVFPGSGSSPHMPVSMIEPRHPSQLYAAFLEGLVVFTYMQLRFWLSDPQKRPAGQLAGEFLIVYAIARIISEQFREPDASLILGVSRGIFYSTFLLAGGIALILLAHKKAEDRGA